MTSTQRFRERYRREILPSRYSGLAHALGVFVVGLGVVLIALVLASRQWRAVDFWIVPITLLIANLVEYTAHRGPMHHRVTVLSALFVRHTCRHHRYFRADEMHFESTRDFHAVLFPPVLLLFFGGTAVLLGLIAALFLSRSAAALFVATSMSYYLCYEVLHFLYHVPPDWRAGRLPGVVWLARLHRTHHSHHGMRAHNYNLVFPLCDWILGTLENGKTVRLPGNRGSAESLTLAHPDKSLPESQR
ncbi:MAG: sterol desaturase family protein [Tahibacter sp.]